MGGNSASKERAKQNAKAAKIAKRKEAAKKK